MARFLRWSALALITHRIWELRREACKSCNGEETNDPCICGSEPCKNCGCSDGSLYELFGCNRCIELDDQQSIDLVDANYYIEVCCPYCSVKQLVKGNAARRPRADVLKCGKCGKRAWLGLEIRFDYDNDINNNVNIEENPIIL